MLDYQDIVSVKRVPPSESHPESHYYIQFEVSKVNGLSVIEKRLSENEEHTATGEEGAVVKGDDNAI